MPKTLVYDGDCPMCVWISETFARLGVIGDGSRRAFQAYDGELAGRMVAAGIRNEMLVLEAGTEELRAGIDGLVWLLEDGRFRWLRGPLSLAPVRWVLRLAYRTIAYNRRILAPPPRGIACACHPDPHAGFRTLLVAVLVAVGAAGAWLLGHAASRAFGGPGALPLAALALLAALLMLLALRVGLPRDPFTLLGNTLVVLAGGALIAAPGLALSLALEGTAARAVVALSVAAGAWRCLTLARRRLRRPGP